MWRRVVLGSLIPCVLLSAAAAFAQRRAVPYWVSQSAGEAMMRTGPGLNFPAVWKYVRPDLPLRVIQVRQEWRKVVDPTGVEGWMRANLLSEQRTAMIAREPAPLRAAPDPAARILWRAEPGVVGKVSHCASGWCELDVGGRAGFVQIAYLWGVEPGETVD